MQNLVDNAMKYSPAGGTCRGGGAAGAGPTGGKAVVAVRDQGQGIEPDEQTHVFQRFYQGGDHLRRGHAGLGLGLYISREIVRRHGGEMWLESTPGKGSTFYFSLPASGPEEDEHQAGAMRRLNWPDKEAEQMAYDPFGEMDELRREIDRTFEEFWGGRRPRRWRGAFLPGRAARRYPLVNLYEDKDNFYVEALAPGVDAGQPGDRRSTGVLTISGEKKGPESVARSPSTAASAPPASSPAASNSAARWTSRTSRPTTSNGVLLITLPKAPETKPRQIAVSAQ